MITTLSLQNFKCFQVLENISFGKVNLFTGSNGRGKSTILQSLLLLAQSIENKPLNHIELNGRFIELGTFDDVRCRCTKAENPTIKFTTDDKDENELTIELAQYNNKQRWASIAKLCVLGKNLVEETGSDSGNDSANSRISLGVTSSIAGLEQLYNVYYISADRKGPTDYIKKNDNGDDKQIGVHGEFLINSLARRGYDFIKLVEDETATILSGATIRVEDTKTDYLQFYLDSSNISEGFRPSNVGFGYSYVLPIITTLLFADKGAKVFIENPEAHLHPGAQSRLIEFLVKYAIEKDIQLFIETHSDHIINGLRIAVSEKLLDRKDAHIVHFNREDSKYPTASQIKIDSNGNLSDYPQGFMDEWGMQMSKLV